jgi:FAD/FMN-containing dehydrogenase
MSWRRFLKTRRALAASFVVACLALFTGRQISEYSAPPDREKNCDFIFPDDPKDGKFTTMIVEPPEQAIRIEERGGFINDASCLNKTPIYGVVKVQSVDDVRSSLEFARANHLKVSIAGQRHSMGGQSFSGNGVVLDMRGFNQITIDRDRKVAHVQAGATWAQIQQLVDKEGLAVQAMQSINVFTVGGSLSVNAHGIAHRPGPVAPTVLSLRIMLANGEIKDASPTENPELFRLALGGYGLFGVILDADLQLVNNEVYALETHDLDYRDFPTYYRTHIADDDRIGLMYGRLSISPMSYLRDAAIHVYRKTDFNGPIPPIQPATHDRLDRFVINFSKTGGFGRWVRWTLEKRFGPKLHSCLSRNQATVQKEACMVSRNEEMNDSMAYLRNQLKDTDILQEYFIPQDRMAEFVDGLRSVVKQDGSNLLNVTIRAVHKDTVTALPYATQDMFAFVLYFNQKLNPEQSRILQKTTVDLVDLAISLNGTFYLPYQLYYSSDQLRRAYPSIDAFFSKKKQYDPDGLFSSKFYEKYGGRILNSPLPSNSH